MEEIIKEILIKSNKPLPRWLIPVLVILLIVGIVAFVIGASSIDPLRAWQSFLINFLFFSGIAQAGVVFSAILHLTRGKWGAPLRRMAEGMAAFLPISFLLFFTLLLGREYLFPWLKHPVTQKASWLNIPFLFSRDGFGLAILYGVSFAFLYYSLRPDLGRAAGIEKGNNKKINSFLISGWKGFNEEKARSERVLSYLAPLLIILYALVFTLIAFDLMMSLDTYWTSTLFGAYFFIGNLYLGLASLAIVAIMLRKYLGLENFITPSTLHDLGKLIFAFCLLSGDFFWSQFIVFWYGNLPEETHYLIIRAWIEPWPVITWGVLVIAFIFPFLYLLSRNVKRKPTTLFFISTIIIIGMWLERFIRIAPSLWPHKTLPLSILEFLITSGFLAAFALSFFWFIKVCPILPLSGPHFSKLIRKKNYLV
jgi:Ni/Fe-hydrogenase subunit HybB-like protein